MINLLPDDHKKEIHAARANVLLVRYVVLLLCGTMFLVLALGMAYVNLSQIKTRSEKIVAENTQKESYYSSIRTDAEAFRSELSDAKSILDSQISYSKAITVVAGLLPSGTAIDTLKLDSSSFGSPMTLKVKIRGESSARQLLANLDKSPYVSQFSKGSISINNSMAYPYSIEVNLTLSKEAATR